MWIFTQLVAFPLNPFQAMALQYIFDKNSKQWYVKVRKSEGWEPDQGSPACPAGHLQHRPQPGLFLLLSSPERVLQLRLPVLPLLEDVKCSEYRESKWFGRWTSHRLLRRRLRGPGGDIVEDWGRLNSYFTPSPANEVSRTRTTSSRCGWCNWWDKSRGKSTTRTSCSCSTPVRAT